MEAKAPPRHRSECDGIDDHQRHAWFLLKLFIYKEILHSLLFFPCLLRAFIHYIITLVRVILRAC